MLCPARPPTGEDTCHSTASLGYAASSKHCDHYTSDVQWWHSPIAASTTSLSCMRSAGGFTRTEDASLEAMAIYWPASSTSTVDTARKHGRRQHCRRSSSSSDLDETRTSTRPPLAAAPSCGRTFRRITSMIFPRRKSPPAKIKPPPSPPAPIAPSMCNTTSSRLSPRLHRLVRKLSLLPRARIGDRPAPPVPYYDPLRWPDPPATARAFPVNPQHLLFSLRHIPDSFADGPRLDNLVCAVRSGLLAISAFVPLRVRRGPNGRLYAVDCRRLYVLRKANVTLATAIELPHPMTEDEVSRSGGNRVELLRSSYGDCCGSMRSLDMTAVNSGSLSRQPSLPQLFC